MQDIVFRVQAPSTALEPIQSDGGIATAEETADPSLSVARPVFPAKGEGMKSFMVRGARGVVFGVIGMEAAHGLIDAGSAVEAIILVLALACVLLADRSHA